MNEDRSTSLLLKAARRTDSPGYVAFSQEPEVLKTEPEDKENAKKKYLVLCFVS